MKSAIQPLAHLALASGLVAGAWLFLPASTPGVEAIQPVGAAAAAEPVPIRLAQADAAPVEHPVSFSAEQAERGKSSFKKSCGECHGDSLKGGLIGGPPLRGDAFLEKFADGMPASGLYGYMISAMPPNAPGRLSAKSYTDMMAFILKENGFKAGAPLPSNIEALDSLIMQK
jgi:mono/diheme cytochrome c family protein